MSLRWGSSPTGVGNEIHPMPCALDAVTSIKTATNIIGDKNAGMVGWSVDVGVCLCVCVCDVGACLFVTACDVLPVAPRLVVCLRSGFGALVCSEMQCNAMQYKSS
mmetsp:Transcript_18596/g.42766  ORF Transcript_18596/g.42766 Transcript_18596/m.42766 type:complete len:106 (-) Transcript_18596:1-318(-)